MYRVVFMFGATACRSELFHNQKSAENFAESVLAVFDGHTTANVVEVSE